MPTIRVFMDTSALLAAIASEKGGAAEILRLAEVGQVEVLVSRQVVTEAERNIRRKLPGGLPFFREALAPILKLVPDPPLEMVEECEGIISSPADAPILAAAMVAQVDYLVTLDRKHFIDDPTVAEKSGLHIGTPGDFLTWFRSKLL